MLELPSVRSRAPFTTGNGAMAIGDGETCPRGMIFFTKFCRVRFSTTAKKINVVFRELLRWYDVFPTTQLCCTKNNCGASRSASEYRVRNFLRDRASATPFHHLVGPTDRPLFSVCLIVSNVGREIICRCEMVAQTDVRGSGKRPSISSELMLGVCYWGE